MRLSPVMFSLILFQLAGSALHAQPSSRIEDHFYRKLVVNRIDLREKINQPLVNTPGAAIENQGVFSQGIVQSLLNGLEKGEYTAYDPDNLSRVMNAQEVLTRLLDFEQSLTGSYNDEPVTDWPDGNEFSDTTAFSPFFNQQQSVPASFDELDLANCESILQFTEQRIFDKVRSEMVYRIEFFQLIWTDPTGALPEKVLATFKYPEIENRLAHTAWTNRFNEAETRNIQEAFELRIFNAYVINLSGEGVRSLDEAAFRRQQMVDYEHHLWNF